MELRTGDKVELTKDAHFPIKGYVIPKGTIGIVTGSFYCKWTREWTPYVDFEDFDVNTYYSCDQLKKVN